MRGWTEEIPYRSDLDFITRSLDMTDRLNGTACFGAAGGSKVGIKVTFALNPGAGVRKLDYASPLWSPPAGGLQGGRKCNFQLHTNEFPVTAWFPERRVRVDGALRPLCRRT